MPDTNLEVLQLLARRNFGLDLNGAAKVASGLNLDLNGISQTLYGRDVNGAFAQLRSLLGGGGVELPGVTGSAISTPNHASFNVSADLDLRVQFESFTLNGNMAFVSRWNTSPNQHWEYRMAVFGQHQFFHSTTGANTIGPTDIGLPLVIPSIQRITLVIATGVLTHFRALGGGDIENGPWEQLDQDTLGATSIFAAGTSDLVIGARANAARDNAMRGRISRMQLRLGGSLVANPDFRFVQPGAANHTDSTGKIWTPTGTAAFT